MARISSSPSFAPDATRLICGVIMQAATSYTCRQTTAAPPRETRAKRGPVMHVPHLPHRDVSCRRPTPRRVCRVLYSVAQAGVRGCLRPVVLDPAGWIAFNLLVFLQVALHPYRRNYPPRPTSSCPYAHTVHTVRNSEEPASIVGKPSGPRKLVAVDW
jgi:hypothetical protein